jgi:membrane protease YdiL (CAAX protease family)
LVRFQFILVDRIGWSAQQARSLICGSIYLIATLAGAIVLFVHYPPLSGTAAFAIRADYLAVLGVTVCAEVSLTVLLARCAISIWFGSHIDAVEQIYRIPWLRSALELPSRWPVIVIFVSGVCEELFFRGALLNSAIYVGMSDAWAILFVTTLFVIQQLTQLNTAVQAALVGCSSVTVSVVGSLSVFGCGSIMPAALAHGIFAVFLTQGARMRSQRILGSIAPL